jgi:type I restriction enzyme S subunit
MSVLIKPNREGEAPAEPYRDGSELPEGWTVAVLSSLCDRLRGVSYGRDDARSEPADGLFPILRANNIDGNQLNFNDLVYVPRARVSENQQLRPGDVVIAMSSGSKSVVGKTAQIFDEWEGSFGAFCGVLRPHAEIDARYFGLFLRTREYRQAISELSAGTNINNLKAEHFDAIQVPFAPLAEQRRIVAKLGELLGRVSQAKARLDRVPALLKRFRQSVLAAACSGKLTADWREENVCDETGEVLLSRIKSSRLKIAAFAKEKNQIESAFGSSLFDVTSEELGFDSLPETWKACRIGAVGSVSNGSTPSRQQPSFWDGDIPWVSSGEVRNNLITSTRERITKAGFDGTSVRLLPRGTVLIAMIGEGKTRGQSAILDLEATINQNIAAAVISHGFVEPAFLWRWFQMRYEATREQGAGSGPQALNCQRVRELPFVLPPLKEQKEIVRRVEQLFAFADQIEARFKKAQAQIERLTQSVLAKAFRGELVPTEAELARRDNRFYEPASELLARIQADRDKGCASTKTTTKKRSVTRK